MSCSESRVPRSYTRERERAADITKVEYITIWQQLGPERTHALGVINAHASKFAGHWGIARNARGYGLRVTKDMLHDVRKALRPEDKSINDRNRALAPSHLWVLKGVMMEATAEELANAICPTWPMLPIRALTQRKTKATWLVEAEENPPTRFLETDRGIILVEEFSQTRSKNSSKAESSKGKGKGKQGFANSAGAALQHPSEGGSDRGDTRKRANSQARALLPFKSSNISSGHAASSDPLAKGDPWSGYKHSQREASSASSSVGQSSHGMQSQTEAHIIARLNKAEAAIDRVESRQDAAEQRMKDMQTFMGERFQDVMTALQSLNEPKRKPRVEEGDHRGGRAYSFAAANVTSFQKRWRQVAQWPHHIICMTETLTHDSDEGWLKPALASCGRTFVKGATCQQVGAGQARKGGLAILCSEDFFAVPLQVPDGLETLYCEARLLLVHVGARASSLRLKIAVYYGKTMQPDENAEEVCSMLQEFSNQSDVATVLTGDFNIPDTHPVWDYVASLGTWTDVHERVQHADQKAYPTCWPSHGPPSRLDYFLVNNVCATHVRSAGRDLEATIPVHVPITMEMEMEAQPLKTMRLPTSIPVDTPGFRFEPPTQAEFEQSQRDLEYHLMRQDVEQAYAHWSAFWESMLLRSASLACPTVSYVGRGCIPREVQVYPKSPQKPVMSEHEAFLSNLLSRICQLRRMIPDGSEHYVGLLQKVTRQVRMLMLRHGAPPPCDPEYGEEADVLRDLQVFVDRILSKEREERRKERARKWKAKALERGGANRTISQAVRKSADKMLRHLVPRDPLQKEPLISIDAMFRELTNYWNTVHDAGSSHLQEWHDTYLSPCQRPPEPQLDDLRAVHVWAHLKSMKAHTARGADGWSVGELRVLPDPALEQLCLIYGACETFSAWPPVFNEVYTTLLQKADDVDASGIRPIGVTCIPYRIWSSLRFQGLQEWSNNVLHPRQTAYRSGYCAQRVSLARALQTEESLLSGAGLTHVSLDLAKAFDRVPHDALISACKHFRMPSKILGLLECRLRDLRFYWKLQGHYSPPNELKRGIIQGCALSCLQFNIILAPLLWAVERTDFCADLSAHADDLHLMDPDDQPLKNAYDVVAHYLDLIGIALQGKKTQCLRAKIGHLEPLQLREHSVRPEGEIQVLGQCHALKIPSRGTAVLFPRLHVCLQRLANIRGLSLPLGVRRKLVQTMALKIIDYAPWQIVPKEQLQDVTAAIVATLHPKLPKHRCAEVVLHVFHPGHTLHPTYVLIYRLVLAVAQHRRTNGPGEQPWPCAPLRIGPRSLLWEALQELDIWVQPDGQAHVATGAPLPMTLPDTPERIKLWQHRWREALRLAFLRKAEQRRPTFEGLGLGIDRQASKMLHTVVGIDQWQHHLLCIATGACITEMSIAYGKEAEAQPCPWCGEQQEDDWHRHWECPHWEEIRLLWLGQHDVQRLPILLKRYGLVPIVRDDYITMGVILRCQAMLLHIELLAVQDKCGTLKREPVQLFPHPNMLQGWLASKAIRTWKREVYEEPTMVVRDLHTVQIGEHEIEPITPISYRCSHCMKTYALSSLSSFSLCPCLPGRMQAVRVPKARASNKMHHYWRYARHGKGGHDYVDSRPGQDIHCKRCGASWVWAQRHALPKQVCLRTKVKELARRVALEDGLPLVRNGHMPTLHPTLSVLVCAFCGLRTGSESVRGFDRVACTRVEQRQERRVRRHAPVHFVPVMHLRLGMARCSRCDFLVPWQHRKRIGRLHVCEAR